MSILTHEEIEAAWVEHGLDECDCHGFARAIEAAVLEKLKQQKPVAWLMVNPHYPNHTPSLHFEPKADWHITWEAVPLYKLPEVK